MESQMVRCCKGFPIRHITPVYIHDVMQSVSTWNASHIIIGMGSTCVHASHVWHLINWASLLVMQLVHNGDVYAGELCPILDITQNGRHFVGIKMNPNFFAFCNW